jgi:hypothetical protein
VDRRQQRVRRHPAGEVQRVEVRAVAVHDGDVVGPAAVRGGPQLEQRVVGAADEGRRHPPRPQLVGEIAVPVVLADDEDPQPGEPCRVAAAASPVRRARRARVPGRRPASPPAPPAASGPSA